MEVLFKYIHYLIKYSNLLFLLYTHINLKTLHLVGIWLNFAVHWFYYLSYLYHSEDSLFLQFMVHFIRINWLPNELQKLASPEISFKNTKFLATMVENLPKICEDMVVST